ncbi:hypothetical protein [Pseudomonas cremoricolorata]|uniref:Uncharacterized protein n=1 Tax=Pseudomonas cremoricolorata TaxID=157783 RepID=A0A089WX93_9PSED|nr:hypothetical protein [Pseudomonas cremoricolorata]AIR91232.1 hypothetical protein LK03_19030 [Pseudomonas cremoricolorata]
MRQDTRKPFYMAASPLLILGASFAAVGASGQSTFGYLAVGFLLPGLVLLLVAFKQRGKR